MTDKPKRDAFGHRAPRERVVKLQEGHKAPKATAKRPPPPPKPEKPSS
jgi:hypothetical protein